MAQASDACRRQVVLFLKPFCLLVFVSISRDSIYSLSLALALALALSHTLLHSHSHTLILAHSHAHPYTYAHTYTHTHTARGRTHARTHVHSPANGAGHCTSTIENQGLDTRPGRALETSRTRVAFLGLRWSVECFTVGAVGAAIRDGLC